MFTLSIIIVKSTFLLFACKHVKSSRLTWAWPLEHFLHGVKFCSHSCDVFHWEALSILCVCIHFGLTRGGVDAQCDNMALLRLLPIVIGWVPSCNSTTIFNNVNMSYPLWFSMLQPHDLSTNRIFYSSLSQYTSYKNKSLTFAQFVVYEPTPLPS